MIRRGSTTPISRPIESTAEHRRPAEARAEGGKRAAPRARKRATPAQIALAWLLAQKPWIVPIPGTTKLHRLDENLGAAGVGLTQDELRDIDGAVSRIPVHGHRYSEQNERMIDR